MAGVSVPEGALFYGRNRRRKVVAFDAALRQLTERVAAETQRMLLDGQTPPPEYEARKCNACSLKNVCQPRRLHPRANVAQWLAKAVED